MSNSQRRNSYTFKKGLTMMAAKAVGIDPDMAVEAGDGARAAINALRRAISAEHSSITRIDRTFHVEFTTP